MRLKLSVCAFVLAGPFLARAGALEIQDGRIRESVSKTLALFEKTGSEWKIPCISCHHQGLAMMAQEAARRHGVPVNEAAAQAHAEKTLGQLSSVDGVVMPVDSFGHGYALLAAHSMHIGPNLATAAYARRFANAQLRDGHWAATDARPPHSASVFTATAIGIRVMQVYLPEQLATGRATRTARACEWLLSHEPKSTEDRSFRLLGLGWGRAPAGDRAKAAGDLLRTQREDGGWAQEIGMESDAYSTGEALFALRQAGGIPATDAAFRVGIEYLLRTQKPDGSWLVKTRLHSPAPISPPYFETGFPHGKDQIISFAGSAWAAMALVEALPEVSHPVKPNAIPAAQPRDLEPWMEAALFGSVDDLRELLDAGVKPDSVTKDGTTLLMMAVPDVDKVRLLLDRGLRSTRRRSPAPTHSRWPQGTPTASE